MPSERPHFFLYRSTCERREICSFPPLAKEEDIRGGMQKKEELFFVVPEFGTRGQRGRNSEYICTGYESFEGSTHTTSQKENLHIYNPCWKLSVLAQRGDERYGTAATHLLLQIYLLVPRKNSA